MIANKFAAECADCGVPVAEKCGFAIGPPWKTKCVTCASWTKPRVRISFAGDKVICVNITFLDKDKREQYKALVCSLGGAWNKDLKGYVVPMNIVARLSKMLKEANYTPEIQPELRDTILLKIAQAKESIAGAAVRADAVDEQMRERGFSLFPFQKEGAQWLAPRRSALLADEPGLGKSCQALAALSATAGAIVVAPAVAKGVWKRETSRWRPDIRYEVLSGMTSFRPPDPGQLLITNYDVLPETLDCQLPEQMTLIADECHMVKSKKSLRSKRFRAIADSVLDRGGKVWLLSGTPMLNTPAELWNVLQTADLEKQAFGTWKRFVEMFGGRKNGFGVFSWGDPTPEVVPALRRVMLRRERSDVLPELPEKIVEDLQLEDLDNDTRQLCDEAVSALNRAGVDLNGAIDLVFLTRLHGAAFKEISKARAALATAKIPMMLELIEEFESQAEPLIVFSAHRAPINVIEHRPGWAVITGNTSPKARTEIEDRFQGGDLRGIAATIDAGGVAITLTRAARMLFVDLDWVPALNQQAEDRIARIGQARGMIITRLIAKHRLDERLFELLSAKQSKFENSVGAATVRHTSELDE